MGLPKMDLICIVDSLYSRFGALGPKISKDGKIVEIREHYPLSPIVNPILVCHYIVRGYNVKILDKPADNHGQYHE